MLVPMSIAALILMLSLLTWTACGKKSPPLPPQSLPPPVVTHVDWKLDGQRVMLRWPVPKEKGKAGPEGFFVYRSKQSLDEELCTGCPQRFEKVGDVSAHKSFEDPFQKGLIVFTEKLEIGYRYGYKVTAYTDSGEESRATQTIQIDVP